MTLDKNKHYAIYVPQDIDRGLVEDRIKNLLEESALNLRITDVNLGPLAYLYSEECEGILIITRNDNIYLRWVRRDCYYDGHLEQIYGDVQHLDINFIMGGIMVNKKVIKHAFV